MKGRFSMYMDIHIRQKELGIRGWGLGKVRRKKLESAAFLFFPH